LHKEQRQEAIRWSPTTGLGLYISRGIVEAHASKLTLTSKPGQATRFSFTLPVYEDIQENIRESNAHSNR